MSLSSEFHSLINDAYIAKATMVKSLENELIQKTPVAEKNGGQLKSAWTTQRTSEGWVLTNNMQYADFILRGRRRLGNRTVGSLQLPDGVYPILQQHNNELEARLKDLKR
jgi:hypothetical protein